MFSSCFLNTNEPTIKSTITYAEWYDELWAELKELFSKKNGPRQNETMSALSNCKQARMIVSAYCAKLKLLWHEWSNYEESPTCTCGMKIVVETKRGN